MLKNEDFERIAGIAQNPAQHGFGKMDYGDNYTISEFDRGSEYMLIVNEKSGGSEEFDISTFVTEDGGMIYLTHVERTGEDGLTEKISVDYPMGVREFLPFDGDEAKDAQDYIRTVEGDNGALISYEHYKDGTRVYDLENRLESNVQDRIEVAWKSHSPRELDSLSRDTDPRVQFAVVSNEHTTGITLDNIERRTDDKETLLAICRHPNVTVNTLGHVLSEREDVSGNALTIEVGKNPNAPEGILAKVYARGVMTSDTEVMCAVCGNPGCPKEVLERGAFSEYKEVRMTVAGNPGTDKNVLAELCRSGDRDIQKEAIQNPSTRYEDLMAVREYTADQDLADTIDYEVEKRSDMAMDMDENDIERNMDYFAAGTSEHMESYGSGVMAEKDEYQDTEDSVEAGMENDWNYETDYDDPVE